MMIAPCIFPISVAAGTPSAAGLSALPAPAASPTAGTGFLFGQIVASLITSQTKPAGEGVQREPGKSAQKALKSEKPEDKKPAAGCPQSLTKAAVAVAVIAAPVSAPATCATCEPAPTAGPNTQAPIAALPSAPATSAGSEPVPTSGTNIQGPIAVPGGPIVPPQQLAPTDAPVIAAESRPAPIRVDQPAGPPSAVPASHRLPQTGEAPASDALPTPAAATVKKPRANIREGAESDEQEAVDVKTRPASVAGNAARPLVQNAKVFDAPSMPACPAALKPIAAPTATDRVDVH